jgi:hypothetical protein
VLIAAANVGGESLDDDAVIGLATAGLNKLRVGNRRDFNFARTNVPSQGVRKQAAKQGQDVHNASVAASALGVVIAIAGVE